MNKDNQFRSSSFFMAEGDILHILINEESYSGSPISIVLDGVETKDVVPGAVVALEATDIISTGFKAHWQLKENCDGYYFNLATDADMTPHVAGFDNLDVGNINELVVTGLTDGVTYYYQISAYNDIGEGAESNVITVGIPAVYVTDIDGNLYTTVIIGTQEWMVQNLRTFTYADGTPIPNLPINADWIAEDGSTGHDGAYCWYNNEDPLDPSADTSIFDYGALYNQHAVDNIHGLAPTGWRVPSDADILVLRTYIGGDTLGGGKLKEVGLTHWDTPNEGATDTYGFKALPAGARVLNGDFYELFTVSVFWLSDMGDQIQMKFNSASLDSYVGYEPNFGFSVRCMRDLTVGTTYVIFTDGITTFRKGVRDHALVVDVALTVLAFSGVEGVDWENVRTVEL